MRRSKRQPIPPTKGTAVNRHTRKRLIAEIEAYLAFWAAAKSA